MLAESNDGKLRDSAGALIGVAGEETDDMSTITAEAKDDADDDTLYLSNYMIGLTTVDGVDEGDADKYYLNSAAKDVTYTFFVDGAVTQNIPVEE